MNKKNKYQNLITHKSFFQLTCDKINRKEETCSKYKSKILNVKKSTVVFLGHIGLILFGSYDHQNIYI
jgi:hypothetical protein